MRLINRRARGDTIIEVLFAITIFSLVAIGGLSIMNKGTATAQRSLEITMVRQQIDAQADILRFLNSSYIASAGNYQDGSPADIWAELVASIDNESTIDSINGAVCPALPLINQAFIFAIDSTAGVSKEALDNSNFSNDPATYSQLRYNEAGDFWKSDGLWIEAHKSDMQSSDPQFNLQKNIGYIDFYIRSCWNSAGQEMPMFIQTIVRLYEPR